jgi:hypothetical protein
MDFPAIFVGTQRVPEMTYQGSDPFHSKKNGVSLPNLRTKPDELLKCLTCTGSGFLSNESARNAE